MADSELLTTLLKLTFTDDLTRLYNRRFLQFFMKQKAPKKLAMILMDVDKFKSINDTYGHPEGDSVLQQVGHVLSQCVGPDDVAIRNGGDEFCVVLPNADKTRGVQVAEAVRAMLAGKPMRIAKTQTNLTVSLSMGLASCPEDAPDPEHLIEKADIALYHTKKTGRGKLSVFGEFDPSFAFDEQLLFANFSHPEFIGRTLEVTEIHRALTDARAGVARLVFIHGASGVGKSRLLRETSRLAEAEGTIYIYVRCAEHSSLSPYRVLLNLFSAYAQNHTNDAPQLLLKLPDDAFTAIAEIFPAATELTGRAPLPLAGTGVERRRLLFNALASIVWDIARKSGLVMLIDNFTQVDLGTQEVLKWLLKVPDCRLLVCAAATTDQLKSLDLFLEYCRSLPLHTEIELLPLTRGETALLIDRVLPSSKRVPDFDDGLHALCQGNPLHLIAALKYLVSENVVRCENRIWTIPETLPPLPATTEALITRLLGGLDKESVEVVTNAAVIGERFHIDTMKQTVEKNEGELLDILDRLEKQNFIEQDGLTDFAFTNTKARQAGYKALEPQQRKEAHRKVAEVELARSADPSILAYHFGQAGDPRAENYKQTLDQQKDLVMRAEECDAFAQVPEVTTPLAAAGVKQIQVMLRLLLNTVRVLRIYPSTAPVVEQSRKAFLEALALCPPTTIGPEKGKLRLNVDVHPDVDGFAKLLEEKRIRSLTFEKGATAQEADELFSTLAAKGDPPDWNSFSARQKLPHIGVVPLAFVSTHTPEGADLTPELIQNVREAFKSFNAALDAHRVYPAGSAVIRDNIRTFVASLEPVFRTWATVTLGMVDGKLVINTLHGDELGSLAMDLVHILQRRKLSSLTFTLGLTENEAETLLSTLARSETPPPLPHVLLAAVEIRMKDYGQPQPTSSQATTPVEQADRLVGVTLESLLSDSVRQRIPSLFEALIVDKQDDLIDRLLKRFLDALQEPLELHRARAADILATLVASPVCRDAVSARTEDAVVNALRSEQAPLPFRHLGAIIQGWVRRALTSGDLDRTLRFLWSLTKTRDLPPELRSVADDLTGSLLNEGLFEKIFAQIADPRAKNIVRAIGPTTLPRLVQLVVETGNMAVYELLREFDPDVHIKLLAEVGSTDKTTRSVNALRALATLAAGKPVVPALAKYVDHPDPRVRLEVLRTAADLGTDGLTLIRTALATQRSTALAIAYERRLTALSAEILALLCKSTDDDSITACCKYFSVCPESSALNDLIRILETRARLFRRGFQDDTRASAVVALSKLNIAAAKQAVESALRDKSPTVSATARSLLGS